jgi:hypothetical protein
VTDALVIEKLQSGEIELDEETGQEEETSCKTENVKGFGSKLSKEEHEQEIKHHPIGPRETILAASKAARMVSDLDLRNFGSPKAHQNRDETVEFSVDGKSFDDLPAIGL